MKKNQNYLQNNKNIEEFQINIEIYFIFVKNLNLKNEEKSKIFPK